MVRGYEWQFREEEMGIGNKQDKMFNFTSNQRFSSCMLLQKPSMILSNYPKF